MRSSSPGRRADPRDRRADDDRVGTPISSGRSTRWRSCGCAAVGPGDLAGLPNARLAILPGTTPSAWRCVSLAGADDRGVPRRAGCG
ncbi:MAG: hypothetical protein U0841_05345 [Chloroflexia bacterium]